MTKRGTRLVAFMVRELSTVKYVYRTYVEGCYDAALNNYGFSKIKPEESKAEIVDAVIAALEVLAKNERDEECEFEAEDDDGDGCEPEIL